MRNAPKLLPIHQTLWQQFEASFVKERFTHALLLVGPLYAKLELLAERMASALCCLQTETTNKPCCQACELVLIKEHPDVHYVSLSESTTIKIDQIRALYPLIYTSPQLSSRRVIIINPADKLNGAAANALLKILEEPSAETHFILISAHISAILPTILSRCQKWYYSPLESQQNYLTEGSFYLLNSPRGKLFEQLDVLIDDLSSITPGTVSLIAQKWLAFEFNDVIWLLYLLHAQMIYFYFSKEHETSALEGKLLKLAKKIKPVVLFEKLDKLNKIIRCSHESIHINHLLALETFLLY